MRILHRLLLVTALSVASATSAHAATTELLPDLVQQVPSDISVTRVAGRDRLGFRSAVYNAGPGPLIVLGRRPDGRTRDMQAFQIVRRADGTARRLSEPIGLLRYVRSVDHSHWHYRPFERYALRRLDGTSVGRDTKSGFCLGDRYRVRRVVGGLAAPVHVGLCGLHRPTLLQVRQGISMGWGDDYGAFLEGQSIDVTGVPAGTYRLVHTVNASGRVRERTRANNSASMRIALSRAGGRVAVTVLGR
jgi:hypothetical protein